MCVTVLLYCVVMWSGEGEGEGAGVAPSLKVATVMSVTLSSDERAVDAVVGARFLEAFKTYMERPQLMLL